MKNEKLFESRLKQLLIYAKEIHELSNSLSSYSHADDRCVLTSEDFKKWDELKIKDNKLSSFTMIYLNQIKSDFLKKWKSYIQTLIKKLKLIENDLKIKEKHESASFTIKFNLALIPDLLKRLNEELIFSEKQNLNRYDRLSSASHSIWWALTVSEQILVEFKM
jgi:hypothetical protein